MSSLADYPTTSVDTSRLAGSYAHRMGDVYSALVRGPDVDLCTPTEVARHAADVMTRARTRRVLIHDGDATLSMQRSAIWQYEQAAWFGLKGLVPKGATDVSDLAPVSKPKAVFALVDACVNIFDTEGEPDVDYKATELHRHTRDILDHAKKKPVTVEHKGTRLTIDDWEEERIRVGVLAALEDVRQFLVARLLHFAEKPETWAFATPYPWVATLSEEDAEAFADELFPHLLEAVRRESLDPFLASLRGWQATAEVSSSEALRKRLEPAQETQAAVITSTPQSAST